MKKQLSLLLALSIIFTGCGPKKVSKKTDKDILANANQSEEVMKSSDIPLIYSYDDSDLFQDGQNVALVDEESIEGETRGYGEDIVATADDVEKEIDQLISLWEEEVPEEQVAQFQFKTINFDINESKIRSDQQNLLDEDISLAVNAVNDGKNIIVQGHSSQEGPASWNMALSQIRAQKVANELIANGVSPDNIEAVGLGSMNPLVWTDKEDHDSIVNELAINRRAEIIIAS